MNRQLSLYEGLRVERMGDEAVVLDPSGEIHRVSGDAVRALDLVEQGVAVGDVPDDLASAVDELVDAGIITGATTWSRRRLLQTGGAAMVAASVVSFALVDPAAAASLCPGGETPTDPSLSGVKTTTPGSYTYTTAPSQTTLLVRAIGAGGGGGGSNGGYTSGCGGGGGSYASAELIVTGCTTYDYNVGQGGTAGNSGNGGTGDSSWFKASSHLVGGGGAGGVMNGGTSSNAAAGTSTIPPIADYVSGTDVTKSGGSGGARASGTGCCDTNRGNGGGGGGGAGSTGNGVNGATGDHLTGSPTGSASGGTGAPGGGTGGRDGGWAGTYSGTAGATPGGGGGGASSANSSGSAGGDGLIWIGV